MNWLLITAAVVVIVILVTLGVAGISLLTRSIIAIGAKAPGSKWENQDIVRILRSVVIFTLLVILLPWSILFTTVGSMADQYFRNKVNHWMSGADLFRHLAIEENDYHDLPLYLKQALAEIVVRRGDEEEAVKQFISRLDAYELDIIGLAAQYALQKYLVAWRSPTKGKVVGDLSYQDLDHLEDIGIIKSTLEFHHVYLRNLSTEESASGNTREEVNLAGNHYAVRLRPVMADETITVSFIELTETGTAVIRAMRRPTSIRYLCQLREQLFQENVAVEIAAISQEGAEEGMYLEISDITSFCNQPITQ